MQLLQDSIGLHDARATAGGLRAGGQVLGRGEAIRLANGLRTPRAAHTEDAGMERLPTQRRAGVQLPLSAAVGQHRVRHTEVLREALHRPAGGHRGDQAVALPRAGVRADAGMAAGAGGAGRAGTHGGEGMRTGRTLAEGLPAGRPAAMDHT